MVISVSSNLYARAQHFAKMAVEADNKGQYGEAINHYLQAAEILVEMTKFTSNPRLVETYQSRAKSYVARAKDLKKQMKKSSRPARTGKGGGDDEESELDDALADAIVTEKPDVTLDDVAGLDDVKIALREAIVLPLMRPDLFTGARRPWKGILLFGPPGCGKTMIAKATAGNIDATFFNISAAHLVSKWLGESEKLVKRLYEMAKEKQPSIIFIDEVDSLTQARGGTENDAMRRIKTQLLTSMEGLTSDPSQRVVTIGATNIPWEIDSAFRRRFERRIYVPVPDFEARKKIFEVNTKGVELDSSVDFAELARLTENYSGSDIATICREAIFIPIRELDAKGAISDPSIKARKVTQDDFLTALANVKSSVSLDELQRFEEWDREYGAG
ncbi:MAG: ATP-binding protein [Methanobacteriota archaeon]|nr:MAG: ATP-binding protein [Euryarchaeota archaeon]